MGRGGRAATPAVGTPASVELPLFPLAVVLFPGGFLQLRIFEPRYLDMIGRCMREASAFGVLLLLEGRDTGSGGARRLAEIGTSARIVDFDTLPDGLLGISCRGERRFRLLSRRTLEDGLNLGQVQWLPEEAAVEWPEAALQLELSEQQRLLEIDEPAERARLLAQLLER